jgi:enoyl-CoA hydratase
MDLIVTGRVIDAATALDWGLVNEVVPAGGALARAMEWGEAIAELPQPAVHTDLEAAERGWGRPLDEGLRIEQECFNRLVDTPEIQEGLRRFNERDHPDRRPGEAATPGIDRRPSGEAASGEAATGGAAYGGAASGEAVS